jgi:hypothetical protein
VVSLYSKPAFLILFFYSLFSVLFSMFYFFIFLFHKRLQDERGGHLIDNAAMLLAGVTGFVENLMSLAAGQSLVPQVNGQTGQLAQGGGKSLCADGLRAHVARKMHGVADDDADDAKPAAKPRQRAQIVTGDAAVAAPPLQRQNRLRRQPQLVRHSHADAAIANIEAQIARLSCDFQLFAPSFRDFFIVPRFQNQGTQS